MTSLSPERERRKRKEKGGAEREEHLGGVVVRSEKVEIPKTVESWLEKVEKKEAKVPTVTDDQGQILVQDVEEEKTKVLLPMTRIEFVKGMKEKVEKAVRWLAEQCFRLLKKYKGRVSFSKAGGRKEETK